MLDPELYEFQKSGETVWRPLHEFGMMSSSTVITICVRKAVPMQNGYYAVKGFCPTYCRASLFDDVIWSIYKEDNTWTLSDIMTDELARENGCIYLGSAED